MTMRRRSASEAAEGAAAKPLFRSFLQGGFECSTHRRRDGRQLDLLSGSRHDQTAERDYRRLRELGVLTVRDGLRWHLIERADGGYQWSSFLPLLRAALRADVEVVWDLCHYGYPEHIDIFSSRFVDRFAAFARAAARLVREESDGQAFYCPINEISFWAWAGGEVAYMAPWRRGEGDRLKVQLVRAALAAIEAIWEVDPGARIVHADPTIRVCADPRRPQDRVLAAGYTEAQFHAWDMLGGVRRPELGGRLRYLDVIGVNYYWKNQWIHEGRMLDVGDPLYRPFRELLVKIHRRYGRPMAVAETGIEGARRTSWMAYMGEETRAAIRAGAAIEGFCWYPILDHPGWDDDRYCPNGLFGYANQSGERVVYGPLAREWALQQRLFQDLAERPKPREPPPVEQPFYAAGHPPVYRER